jgi:hypothetical protein
MKEIGREKRDLINATDTPEKKDVTDLLHVPVR